MQHLNASIFVVPSNFGFKVESTANEDKISVKRFCFKSVNLGLSVFEQYKPPTSKIPNVQLKLRNGMMQASNQQYTLKMNITAVL